jgi:MOSC domain-containing protein YiiM
MFGVPSGVLGDPSGLLASGGELVDGVVVASLDLHLSQARPYGEPEQLSGTVEALLLAADAEAPLTRVAEATATAGRGLEGDRYALGRGTFSGAGRGYELTLIEAKALEALAAAGTTVSWEDARRNVVTRGIGLNALVGREFTIGEVRCVGRRLAEPCAHLQRLAPDGVLHGLVHRGGLRADIVSGGTIRVGDAVAAVPDPA